MGFDSLRHIVRQSHISSHAQYERFETAVQAHHLLCSSDIAAIRTKTMIEPEQPNLKQGGLNGAFSGAGAFLFVDAEVLEPGLPLWRRWHLSPVWCLYLAPPLANMRIKYSQQAANKSRLNSSAAFRAPITRSLIRISIALLHLVAIPWLMSNFHRSAAKLMALKVVNGATWINA